MAGKGQLSCQRRSQFCESILNDLLVDREKREGRSGDGTDAHAGGTAQNWESAMLDLSKITISNCMVRKVLRIVSLTRQPCLLDACSKRRRHHVLQDFSTRSTHHHPIVPVPIQNESNDHQSNKRKTHWDVQHNRSHPTQPLLITLALARKRSVSVQQDGFVQRCGTLRLVVVCILVGIASRG